MKALFLSKDLIKINRVGVQYVYVHVMYQSAVFQIYKDMSNKGNSSIPLLESHKSIKRKQIRVTN